LRVLSIFGTRPEAVKMAPVVRQLARTTEIESLVCVTAQHRQMLDQVLNLFEIRPDYDLNLMRSNQSLAGLTADIFTRLDPLLAEIAPDWILIQGDTTTVMCAALLAFYQRIKVGHVEAGLRTRDKWQPFPEEINRRVAGVVADLHFAPTEWSRANLLAEGVDESSIHVTGNPVVDALHEIIRHEPPAGAQKLLTELGINAGGKKLALVTVHRRENFGQPLENICAALKELAELYGNLELVYPVHLNPHVREPVFRMLGGVKNIHLLEPLDYLSMVYLERSANLILTDSGGVQEEATVLGIPTLVLREVTERPEGVQSGALTLAGTDKAKILAEANRLLTVGKKQTDTRQTSLFGDGHAAERIVSILLKQDNPQSEDGLSLAK
jgi:UDP-N-acetylglucosamine 2-epimerase (non-hydrolysing)